MNNIFEIVLCTLALISICFATPNCLELHQSQLNSLNERMNQMLSALYSSPILSKLQSVTKTQPNISSTTEPEDPEPVYDPSPQQPSTSQTPQVVFVASKYPPPVPAAPAAVNTRTPRSYYSQELPPEYSYSPWSQYYDPYHSALVPNYLPLHPVSNSYEPYREPEYMPPTPYPYSAPTYHPPPAYYAPPPTYHTPPPVYQAPPPAYHIPPYHAPPTYHTPPSVYPPSPGIAYSSPYATIADYPYYA